MARWGEGDPRWIVEERADATNVNNWHWTEKNATVWSKEKLTSLLTGLVIDDDKYFSEIKEVTKIEGEASANNRKSKLFFFYEWEIKAEWTGKLRSEDKSFNGFLEIPNLSEEHDPDDVDINVTLKEGNEGGHAVKEFIRTKGIATIRKQLAKYIKDLKEEFSQGMILPKKDGSTSSTSVTTKDSQSNGIQSKEAMMQPVTDQTAKLSMGVKIKCKNLKSEEEFKCRAAELYRALTDRDMIRAFTRGEAVVDPTKGGRFTLFGGNVHGDYTELVAEKLIRMRWRFKSWPDEHYSNVTLELEQREDCTVLKLSQTGIPETEYEKTSEGWKNYYWRSIKQTFGFGACLF